MPRVIITGAAAQGMNRCRQFLKEKNPQAARRAGQVIASYLTRLGQAPEIGRPLDDEPRLRELVIPFGGAGYVALYRHDPAAGAVVVLAFRHQREAGY